MSTGDIATTNARAADLLAHGIHIQTRTIPAGSPWRVHGAWAGLVVVEGETVSQWLAATQCEAASLAVEAAEVLLRDRGEAVAS